MESLRVLVVDDDVGDQLILSRALADGPHPVEVETASNVLEFHQSIQAKSFDCVLVDYNLSVDCNAEVLVEELKKTHPNCPVIVVSNSDAQDIVVRCFQSGTTDFMNKSEVLDSTAFWSRIHAAVEKGKRLCSERRVAQRRIQKLVDLTETDPLTGLSNRRSIERVIRPGRRKVFDRRGFVSVMMLDIDHFKNVNDQFGHEFGDRVLCAVAQVLGNARISSAHAVRWGGEEFLLFAPDTGAPEARHLANGVRESIAGLRIANGDTNVTVTASMGLSTVRSDSLSMTVVHQADQALYLAKRSGRNRVCTFEMVIFDQLAREAKAADPEERLGEILARARGQLGPAQQEHLIAHSQAVSKIAVNIAKKLGASDRDIKRVRLAGLCHDIGKFSIPDEVLNKVGTLTPAERFCLNKEPEDSALMAETLGADKATTDCIRRYHVRYDAPGRSSNRKNRGALPDDQILSVADAFAAMIGGRPYRPLMSRDAAKDELKRNRGGQFNPAVVDAALCVV